jgi:branched-chain amino acid aminotransferase
VLDGVKSLSYASNMLASRLARERGFDDALLVTPHGRVLETPTASFFWVSEGRVLTPPLADHILASITRARVLELTDGSEAPCTRDDVAAADEAFVASTLREAMPVAAVEDRELPPGGPVTTRVAAALRERIEAELAAG